MLTFKQFRDIEALDAVLVSENLTVFEFLEEGKWVASQFDNNIRIDQPSHGVGQTHAHIFGRRKNSELGVVNLDGSASHGSKFRISSKDSDALRRRGFCIPVSNIVEWISLASQPRLLLEG